MNLISQNIFIPHSELLHSLVKVPNIIKSLALSYLILSSGVMGASTTSKIQSSRVKCPPKNLNMVGTGANQLVNTFCQCPEAAELLSNTAALYQTIHITVGKYPTSSAQTSGLALVNTEKLSPETAAALLQRSINDQTFSIFIDQREDLKELTDQPRSRLQSLLFELNNGVQKSSWNKRVIEAHKGELSREQYALQTEEMEWVTSRNTLKFLSECQPIWKNPYDMDAATFEENLFSQEIDGHTDFIRANWYERYQTVYCSKHPKDIENCENSKPELFDYYAYTQKTEKERHQIMLDRIVTNFHKASPKLQNEMFERFGDELKQKISQKRNKDKEL